MMVIRLETGASQTVMVDATNMFGGDPAIAVEQGEKYAFDCSPNQK